MGWEAVGGVPMRETGVAVSGIGAGAKPPLARSSDLLSRPLPPADLCEMCGHRRGFHTAGTDGAGWCGDPENCDCGGFQGRRK